MRKIIFSLSAAFLTTGLWAQQNALLDRAFWGNNPSVAEVQAAIKKGNSPVEMNNRSFDAIATAIMADAPMEDIQYLVSLKETDINTITHDGRTYIFWAAYKNNLPLVKYLVENGATVNLKDGHGIPLMNFATYGKVTDVAMYDYLIAKGADVQLTTKDGATVFLLAMQYIQDDSLIKFFESHGLSSETEDANGNNAMFYAARSGNATMLKTLKARGINYKKQNKAGENIILYAAHGTRGGNANLETYEYLKGLGVPVNTVSAEGDTPLLLAAGNAKDPRVIQFFIDNGINVNATNKAGDNALINAAQRNSYDVVKILADKTKDVNHSNKDDKTALMYAVQGNDTQTVALLLDKGAKVSAVDNDGHTLLYYWVNERGARGVKPTPNIEKLQLLKEHGFDISKAEPNGNNLWHLAVEKGSFELMEMAKESNVAINAKNNEGYTPLLLAAMNAKNTEILEFLVANGADTKSTTDFEETAYDLAAENEVLKKNKASLTFLKK
ncbi:Ankyrin repeat [Pustulibacterium marinum]|uniref:Ankyrin repeat n=1 Tax=Pustulibacterium marinum TaxID=1224947 RepID=A0A1I7GBU6_9FLAO|nr:ankyrin repeat domain-containing protein [Pustulibacterium marinum]SFU45726.1 Ankyrin repeat [Pustulibacterium marinum]